MEIIFFYPKKRKNITQVCLESTVEILHRITETQSALTLVET